MQVHEVEGIATAVVPQRWRAEMVDEVRRLGVKGLSVSLPSHRDVEFVRSFPDLELLVVSTGTEIRDLSAIEELRCLTHLMLSVPPRPALRLDFSELPHLVHVGISWNPGFASVFACPELQWLNVGNPPDPDLHRFAELPRLKYLGVSAGRKLQSTAGIEALGRLEVLDLYGQGSLETLRGVGQLAQLRELNLETCKRIGDIEELSTLRGLTKLKLANCGDLASLAPIASMRELTTLIAWESTRILDGDLAVLLELPRLRTIAFRSRREYRPSVEEIEQILASRSTI